MRYLLASDIHACAASEQLVFLDLLRDRYLSLSRGHTKILRSVLCPRGGPNHPAENEGDPTAHRLAEAMVRRGLLTIDPARGRPVQGPAVAPATTDLHCEPTPPTRRPSARDVMRFLAAARHATRLLAKGSLAEAVTHVGRLKQGQIAGHEPFEREQIGHAVDVFCKLRPLYGRNRLCLFDSLALLEFLSCKGLYPTWVFGVTIEPFQAHCWVQTRGLLLNDTVEAISHYTPIMAV